MKRFDEDDLEDSGKGEMAESFEEFVDELRDEIVDGQTDELGRVSKSVKTEEENPREKLKKEIQPKDKEDGPGELVEQFWQEKEIKYLLDKRKKMGNDELEEFFQKKSKLHDIDYNPFSRTEEKLIIQKHKSKTPDQLASMLEREEKVIKLKLELMGLQPKTPE